MDIHVPVAPDPVRLRHHLIIGKAFSSALFHPFPETVHHIKRNIIDLVLRCKGEDNEGNSALGFKFLHERDLVRVDVLKWERPHRAFLRVKADRNPLNRADIVDRTFHIEVRQRDMAALFVDLDGRDRGRDLLDQCQLLFPVAVIGPVDQIFQRGTTKAPGFPCSHSCSLSSIQIFSSDLHKFFMSTICLPHSCPALPDFMAA